VAQLQELPIDSVKVDCRFINDLHRSESQVAITSTMVELALRLKLHVVAEGVEDASAEEKLITMGCHSAQGFYYSRPFALHGLHAWLGQWQRQLKEQSDSGTVEDTSNRMKPQSSV
jgi:EAL domain-containing protein (putative c-di-GMP-specific phosphodiesterase class I)